MIEKLLYAALVLALLAMFALDPNFMENLSRTFDGTEVVLPQIDPWVAGAGGILLGLAAASWGLYWAEGADLHLRDLPVAALSHRALDRVS
jgi:hypothetical protein